MLNLSFVAYKVTRLVCNISNSKDRAGLTTFLNIQKRVENTTRSGVFSTNFEVFGNVVNHYLECLMYLFARN